MEKEEKNEKLLSTSWKARNVMFRAEIASGSSPLGYKRDSIEYCRLNIHPSTTFYLINISKIPPLDHKFSYFLTCII